MWVHLVDNKDFEELVHFDNKDFAELCLERMHKWESDPDLLDLWRGYYYFMYVDNYSDDSKEHSTVEEIVDKDYVIYRRVVILNHDYHEEPELALEELSDEGYSFNSIEELVDTIMYERDGKSFII